MIALIIGSLVCWLINFKLSSGSYLAWGERGGGGGGTEVTSHTYYYYKIKFPHTSIDPSNSIIFYDALGAPVYTLPPYSEYMNYGEGILAVPGTEQNTTVEGVATATYYVFYSTDDLIIDYEKAEFKIAKKLIKYPAQTSVKATYQYLSVITPFKDIASVIDGRYDTQVQTEFFAEPPTGFNYAILDLGSVKEIQAIDIIAGFYKPDSVRKYDINFTLSLEYSIDGTNYYIISDKTQNIDFTGGVGKSFEESDLGVGFEARYFKMILENVGRVEYGSMKVLQSNVTISPNLDPITAIVTIPFSAKQTEDTIISYGVYVVALTEIAAYNDIVIKANATLIPTCILTENANIGANTITVDSTENFDELESGETTVTGYIDNNDGSYDSFTYTGLTSTSFTGVTGLTSNHVIGDKLVQELEGDTTVYDYKGLRRQLKDRLYKSVKVDNSTLYSQSQLDYVSKMYLKEFIKNHSKVQVEVLYSPHIEIGQTIKIVDPYNNIDTNYFVESISDNNGNYTLVLARYSENDLIYT